MKSIKLIQRGLRFYWRTHLGVALAAAVATAVLAGAMIVGDSVRASLRHIALARLGKTTLAMNTADRFFTTQLADEIAKKLNCDAAAVVDVPGVASAQGGQHRAAGVHVLGVDTAFWKLGDGDVPLPDDGVVLNERLAAQLRATVGERVVLRLAKPSALPRDIPLGSEAEDSISVSLTVSAIADEDHMGPFSLLANQIPPFNAFVSRKLIQEKAKLAGRANLLLLNGEVSAETADAAIASSWRLADIDVDIRTLDKLGLVELRSGRVFLDRPIVDAAMKTGDDATPVLTYFVNELRKDAEHVTPYSMVTARADINDDNVVITQWLADDLAAKVGDKLTLKYFVLGDQRQLVEQSSDFTVSAIVPAEGPGGDRELMPMFPGLADVDKALDWQPGIPIDLKRIRDKDEKYWDEHRGAPKAFVSLAWAKQHWANRFGELTAVRWPAKDHDAKTIAHQVHDAMNPAALGLVITPVRDAAIAASQQGTDFGGLFIGLSFFLIVAAMVLTALMFAFGVEQRSSEIGTLLALGFTPKRVRRLWLLEGGALAIIGALIGLPLAIGYTHLVLGALGSQWSGAVAQTSLRYHADPMTLITGGAIGVIVALCTMAWSLRKAARQPARALMAARFGIETAHEKRGKQWGFWIGIFCLIAGVGTVVTLIAEGKSADAEGFFSAGSLLLIGGLCLCGRLLRGAGEGKSAHMTLGSLGWRNSGRRRGRSLATISMLACGSFLVVSINAFRHDPNQASRLGTGGYALFAQTTLPVYHNLNTAEGRAAYGIDEAAMKDVDVLAMRLRAGDEASCLNLNKPRTPPLLGVDPRKLQARQAFDGEWAKLSEKQKDGSTPAIMDAAVAQWIMHLSIGDTLDDTDERGRPYKLKLVGVLPPSVMQGFMLIANDQFEERYPSIGGTRVMLIDAPPERVDAVKDALDRALADAGIESMTTAKRLAMFSEVENTYLSIFAALGGLGLILGCVGLGLVAARNVLERRSELALMRSLGFAKRSLIWLVLAEHWGLLMLGLAVGVIAAAVAIVPSLSQAGAPAGMMIVTLVGVIVSGLVWTAAATAAALRGRLTAALRNE
ncbi:MAG: FtsX-like permease family protein [Planctomycetes bacterium]|nr:FtsX-like permease family protein [Planctomycetota bacterium]